MKKLREILGEDYASLEKDLASWKQRKQSAMQPQTSAFPKSDPDWASKMHDKFNDVLNRKDAPKTVSSGPVDTTGANSPFADPSVKSYTPKDTVTPDKPMVGKDPAVVKALASKGYDETGKKIEKVVAIPKDTGVAKADTPVGSIQKTKTPSIPIPKQKPEQSEITMQKGQKIWDIAGGDPKRVKEIMKLNPGLNPKKIQIGYKLKLK